MSTVLKSAHASASANEFSEDAGRTLARYAAELKFETLPPAVVRLTKQCILDALGTTLAATTLAPEAPMFYDYVNDVGGRKECTLIGYGDKAPAQMAAFLNGCNSHMMDFDDVGSGHVSVATTSVAWAMAEKSAALYNDKIAGRELLTAIAAGIDIHTRLFTYDSTEEWDLRQPWSATQALGYISGAAVGGRLMRMPVDQIINAVGLGYQQIAGASQRHLGMHAGWCSHSAVLAVLLAKRGVPGVTDILNGRNGMYQVYLQGDKPDYQRLVGDLGQRFRTLELHGFKAWPACGATRRPVTAIIELRKQHGIKPEDVEAITVYGGEHLFRLSEPAELKRRPPHGAQAKFSLPFTCGVAMAYGDVRLRNYTPEGLKDKKVLDMADRIWVKKDENPARKADTASVEIKLRGGTTHRLEVEHPLGDDRKNAMSQQQIEAKFRDCASFAKKPMSAADIDHIVNMVGDLENVADVTDILKLL